MRYILTSSVRRRDYVSPRRSGAESADHRPLGILVAAGPRIARGAADELSLYDVCPTARRSSNRSPTGSTGKKVGLRRGSPDVADRLRLSWFGHSSPVGRAVQVVKDQTRDDDPSHRDDDQQHARHREGGVTEELPEAGTVPRDKDQTRHG
jgi:hypothetical protein